MNNFYWCNREDRLSVELKGVNKSLNTTTHSHLVRFTTWNETAEVVNELKNVKLQMSFPKYYSHKNNVWHKSSSKSKIPRLNTPFGSPFTKDYTTTIPFFNSANQSMWKACWKRSAPPLIWELLHFSLTTTSVNPCTWVSWGQSSEARSLYGPGHLGINVSVRFTVARLAISLRNRWKVRCLAI